MWSNVVCQSRLINFLIKYKRQLMNALVQEKLEAINDFSASIRPSGTKHGWPRFVDDIEEQVRITRQE
jgi:hypothetical protein